MKKERKSWLLMPELACRPGKSLISEQVENRAAFLHALPPTSQPPLYESCIGHPRRCAVLGVGSVCRVSLPSSPGSWYKARTEFLSTSARVSCHLGMMVSPEDGRPRAPSASWRTTGPRSSPQGREERRCPAFLSLGEAGAWVITGNG